MRRVKSILNDFCPPIIKRIISGERKSHKNFSCEFSSWQEAEIECDGYTSQNIIEKVLAAAIKVKNGEYRYERDSVLFSQIVYSWPILAALLWIASQQNGKLSVLDFGGSLGSSYFQNKFFLKELKSFKWNIVEQEKFVALGRKFIETDQLKFYSSIHDCINYDHPNVILLSSVIQYIGAYENILREIVNVGANYILFDRTPVLKTGERERIFMQVVPDSIYNASYPCRFFVEEHLIQYFSVSGYSLVESFRALDDLDERAIWKGYIFKRKLITENRS